MADVQRPTVLTILAVLAIIGGVFSAIGAVLLIIGTIAIVISGAAGLTGILSLVIALISVGIGIVGLIAGIAVMGNKKTGVDLMKKYAMANIAYQVVFVIYTLVVLSGAVSWSSVVIGLAISGAILYFLMMNEGVKSYADSL